MGIHVNFEGCISFSKMLNLRFIGLIQFFSLTGFKVAMLEYVEFNRIYDLGKRSLGGEDEDVSFTRLQNGRIMKYIIHIINIYFDK